MRAFFVSDIHLFSMEDPRAGILLRFLKSLERDTTHLFLMGDIFDLWIADHDIFANKFAQLSHEIVNLVRRGVEVHYFEGNHDFHLKEFWQDKVGARVHEAPYYMTLGNYRVRLEHGDETNPEDRLYRFQRWTLRTWLLEKMCFLAPSWFVRFIGETWSGQSRKKRPYVNQSLKDRVRRFVQEKSRERHFDLMICGHTHMRDDFEFEVNGKKSRFINLGTWLEKPSTLEVTNESIQFIELN